MAEQGGQQLQPLFDEVPIEGGEIKDLDPTGSVQFHEVKHRADTARKLAYVLVAMLGVSWILHYIAMAICEWHGNHDAAENLSKDFSSWLPIISGLVGGAVTYYFTRESK
jgi:hypothetical protein